MNPLSRKLFLFLPSLIFFSCFCNTGETNKHTLGFRPKKGKVYHLSLTRLQTTLRSAYGSYPASNVCDTLTMNAELKNEYEKDSTIVMSCKFLNVEEKQSPSGFKKIQKKGSFSVSPQDILEKRRQVFYLLEGMTVTVTFNRRGEVEEVSGTEDMADSLSAMLKVPPFRNGRLNGRPFQ